eukprot:2680370-Pyramimonas_sp.AAC.1
MCLRGSKELPSLPRRKAAEGWRKVGGSETRPPPLAEARGSSAEGGGSKKCAPQETNTFLY